MVWERLLAAWQQRVAYSTAKWQALAAALCFHKRKLLSKALAAWAAGALQQQEARLTAGGALQRMQQRWEAGRASRTVHAWLHAAQNQAAQRQLVDHLQALQRQRLQALVSLQEACGAQRQLAPPPSRLTLTCCRCYRCCYSGVQRSATSSGWRLRLTAWRRWLHACGCATACSAGSAWRRHWRGSGVRSCGGWCRPGRA